MIIVRGRKEVYITIARRDNQRTSFLSVDGDGGYITFLQCGEMSKLIDGNDGTH